jgi:hypothetical protein
MEGLYVAYLAGRYGASVALFAIRARAFVGVDSAVRSGTAKSCLLKTAFGPT